MAIIKKINRSKSNPDRSYTTVLDTDTGATSCDCPGWINLRAGKVRDCTHTKTLRAEHAAAPVTTTAKAVAKAAVVTVTLTPGEQGPQTAVRAALKAVAKAKAVEPMLASAMTKGQRLDAYMTAAWVMEEKEDGHRLLVRVSGGRAVAQSRAGNARILPAQVAAPLSALPDGLYDGELVVPGGTSTDVTKAENFGKLVYVMFDLLDCLGIDCRTNSYADRRAALEVAYDHIVRAGLDIGSVRLTNSKPVTETGLAAIFNDGTAVSAAEGAILKLRSSKYREGARSADWIKVKRQGHATVTILGFEDGDTGIACGRTRVVNGSGREFTVKTKNNRMIATARTNAAALIGSRWVVQYTEQLASGAYRHPGLDHAAGDGE